MDYWREKDTGVYIWLGRPPECVWIFVCVTTWVQNSIVSEEWWCVCALGRLPIHSPDIFTTRSVCRLSRGEPQNTGTMSRRGRERPTLWAASESRPISEQHLHVQPLHDSHSSPDFYCSVTQHQSLDFNNSRKSQSPILQLYQTVSEFKYHFLQLQTTLKLYCSSFTMKPVLNWIQPFIITLQSYVTATVI